MRRFPRTGFLLMAPHAPLHRAAYEGVSSPRAGFSPRVARRASTRHDVNLSMERLVSKSVFVRKCELHRIIKGFIGITPFLSNATFDDTNSFALFNLVSTASTEACLVSTASTEACCTVSLYTLRIDCETARTPRFIHFWEKP